MKKYIQINPHEIHLFDPHELRMEEKPTCIICYISSEAKDPIRIIDPHYPHYPHFSVPYPDLNIWDPDVEIDQSVVLRIDMESHFALFVTRILTVNAPLITFQMIKNFWLGENIDSYDFEFGSAKLNPNSERIANSLEMIAKSLEKMSVEVDFAPGGDKFQEGKEDFEKRMKS